MRYRHFGRTGLFVSELTLGAMTFGQAKGIWPTIAGLDASGTEALVGTALDAGVNLIDTADAYAEGESERLLGAALASLKRPRDQFLIATKVRSRTGPGPNQVGLSRAHIMDSIDGSLRRLHLEFIDLYQVHHCDPETPIEETIRALDDIVRAGKVRYIGFSNLSAWHAMKALAYADANRLARFVSAQVYYSLVGRDIEREMVPFAQDQGLAILPWSPLAGGLLSGKFDLEQPGPEGARRTTFDLPPVDRSRGKAVLGALRTVSKDTGHTVAQVALAWLLTRGFVTSIIIGARTREQLVDNLAAGEVALAPEHVEQLDVASALPAEYPAWIVEISNLDRRRATV